MKKLIGRCKTCRYWDQKYPDNKQLGVCTVMGVFLWGLQNTEGLPDVAINTGDWGHRPSSDVQDVRTRDDFGCIQYED